MHKRFLPAFLIILILATASCTGAKLNTSDQPDESSDSGISDTGPPQGQNGSDDRSSIKPIETEIDGSPVNISTRQDELILELGDPEPVAHTLTFLISSNTVSNFTPCGCHSGKWGGMPRRGTIFSQVENEVDWPVVYIDTGDITQGSSTEIQHEKDEYIFQAYEVMDYDFINVGLNELRLGYDELARIENEYGIHWTSLNTYAPGLFPDIPPDLPAGVEGVETINNGAAGIPESLPGTHTPLFQPYEIVEPDGLRDFKIGFIGAMIHPSARLNPLNASFSFEQYVDTVPRTVEFLRTRENVDLVVLVCDADSFDNIRLDEISDGIDMIIGGVTQLQRSPNAMLNPANQLFNPGMADMAEYQDSVLMLSTLPQPLMVPKASSRGRLVTRLDITVSETGRIVAYYSTEIQVSDAYEDDPRMNRIAQGYDTHILSVELIANVERSYTGSNSCEHCHPGYTRAWSNHGHFQAYRTIANSGSLTDRECTRCHAIGFMEEPRLLTYDLIPDHLRNVGCEGCHPNGQAHINTQNHLATLSPEELAEQNISDAMGVVTNINVCVKCHTGDWAEGFNYQEAMDAARAICQSVE